MSKKPLFPDRRDGFLKQYPAFERWLIERGSEILVVTNQYELARFTTPEGVGIIYQNKVGKIESSHWQNGADEAWRAWKHNKAWNVGKKIKRTGKPDRQICAVIARDGDRCFYCREPFTEDNGPTREHFVAVAHGGPNHLSNLAVAHLECNNAAGHMSVAGKMAYAHRCWIEHAAKPPKEKPDEPADDKRHDQAIERGNNIDQSWSDCPELSA